MKKIICITTFFFLTTIVNAQKSNLVSGHMHPEQKSNEIFLGNFDTEYYTEYVFNKNTGRYHANNVWDPRIALSKNLSSVGFKTKRIGIVAYDVYGKQMEKMRPVFVQQYEYVRYQKKKK